jgi:hypothetical protein
VAQLLDSLIKRVPAEFPDDVALRARLYASIGPNYTAQGRLSDAASVLDSAVILARRAYGERSDEFASASLEMASALLPPDESERHVNAALAALAGRETERPSLYARGLLGLAAVRGMAGAVREADSLARRVIAIELARTTGPTTTRARAVAQVAAATAWIHRDPRMVDSMFAHAIAISDSLNTPLAFERLHAIDGRIDALTVLGRYERADSLLREGLAAARRGYGDLGRESILFLARASQLARLAGNLALASTLADSAWRLSEGNADLSATLVIIAGGARLTDEWSRRRFHAADTVARRMLSRVAEQRVPVTIVFGALFAGLASINIEDWLGAERHLRLGFASLPASRDLDSMRDRLNRPLAQALAGQGRQREADSVQALVAPAQPVARCRPGGDWRGC